MKTLNNDNSCPRVLLVLDTTHGQIGGTEQNTLRFAQTLLKRNYLPIVMEVGKAILSRSEDAKNLQIHHIDTPHFDTVAFSIWRKRLAQIQPAVIIRSKTWVGSFNWKLDLAALLSKARYLGWEHHPAIKPVDYKTFKAKTKVLVRNHLHINSVTKIVAVSEAVSEPLIQYYPVPPAKVDVIYPGVDFNFFKHMEQARQELRAAWGIPQSAFVIGSLGRLVAHKGNDFTLQVMAEIKKLHPELNIWCVIAGKGSDLARLENLAESLGIKEWVRFPGWQESAPNAWSALDLFLMPSSDEGLGMTLIEAVACGCLSLGAAVGGMKEILSGPAQEYGLPPSKLDTWVKMTARIATFTVDQRKEQQQAIYQNLRTRFDAEKQWNLMVDWVEKHSDLSTKNDL